MLLGALGNFEYPRLLLKLFGARCNFDCPTIRFLGALVKFYRQCPGKFDGHGTVKIRLKFGAGKNHSAGHRTVFDHKGSVC